MVERDLLDKINTLLSVRSMSQLSASVFSNRRELATFQQAAIDVAVQVATVKTMVVNKIYLEVVGDKPYDEITQVDV